jgi:hypothetical protein
MRVIQIPGGLKAISLGTQSEADKTQAIVNARHAFVQKYCQEQGWSSNPEELSMAQILQIRQQDGWKNPCPT